MLSLVNLEYIQQKLLHVSYLVDLQRERNHAFIDKVVEWLICLEEIMKSNNLPEAGKIGSLRARILTAQMGIIENEFSLPGGATIRKGKVKSAIALRVIGDTCDLVLTTLRNDSERFAEAERIMNQVVALADSKGLIDDFPFGRVDSTVLSAFWKRFASDPDLKQGVTSIEGLISPNDSKVLLDRRLISFDKR